MKREKRVMKKGVKDDTKDEKITVTRRRKGARLDRLFAHVSERAPNIKKQDVFLFQKTRLAIISK
jgi:hypothetical protein